MPAVQRLLFPDPQLAVRLPPVPLLDSTAAPATIGLFSHPTFSRIGDAALKPSAFGILPLAGKETQFMMTNPGNGKSSSLFQKKATLVMLAATILLPSIQRTEAATNVVVWDTGSRLADAADVESRAGWIPVPAELFASETDPPKAASDPGYYGREYSFKGDAIVENRSLVAVFWSAKGRVVIYSKDGANLSGDATHGAWPGRKIVECVPLQTKTQPTSISR